MAGSRVATPIKLLAIWY